MNVDQCTNLSLCSGGGGLDLGLELALGSLRTVCWVEWEAFAIEYLAAAMEAGCLVQTPVWTDLRTFDGRPWRGVVDCLTAGYPCQPFSVAGKRRGQDDPRHLWPHVRRVIGEVEPAIVFLENVPGHLSLGFGEVAGDLESLGYEVAAGLFTAEEVGASHKRERLFIIAVANDQSERRREGRPESEGREGQSISSDASVAVEKSNQPTTWSGCQQARNEERRSCNGGGSATLSQRPSPDGRASSASGAVGDPGGLFQGRWAVEERETYWGIAPAGPGENVGDAASRGTVSAQQPGQPCGIEPPSPALADAECSERRPTVPEQQMQAGKSSSGRKVQKPLARTAEIWRSPNARDYHPPGKHQNGQPDQLTLPEQARNESACHCSRLDPKKSKHGRESSQSTRRLSPRFVGWLMGWPPTDSGSWEMGSCPSKPPMPSFPSGQLCEPPNEGWPEWRSRMKTALIRLVHQVSSNPPEGIQ